MYATNEFEKMALNLAKGVSMTSKGDMYLALFLSDPSETGGGQEVTYSGYARMPVVFSTPAQESDSITIQNTQDISFAMPTTSVGNVKWIGIMDNVSAGTMLLYGELDEALNITANRTPVVRAGMLKYLLAGKTSVAYRRKLMGFFNGNSLTGFSPYMALFNGSPEAGGSEFTGGAYERKLMEFSTPAEQAEGAMMISNTALILSPQATATWGNLTHVALYDRESNGEPWQIVEVAAGLITRGGAVQYPIGYFKVHLN